ncbi:MAG TPA: sigma-70 family RNA polymerase sigma factor [Xanthobacteraceae bacterium]|nr:sigma-70 family RNA polymerase sigma factor [Xanthobacteraceae bacterium]
MQHVFRHKPYRLVAHVQDPLEARDRDLARRCLSAARRFSANAAAARPLRFQAANSAVFGRRDSFTSGTVLEFAEPSLYGNSMQEADRIARVILLGLADDTAEAWTDFVHLAKGPVWKASLAGAPRKARAEELFSHVMSRFHVERLVLPGRFAASGLSEFSSFLTREISGHIDHWLLHLLRSGAPDAADAFVRALQTDIQMWVQRAAPPAARTTLDDLVQDVFANLLADKGRRILAFAGGGTFRAYLRKVVVNLAADSARREFGRVRVSSTSGAVSSRPRLVSLNDEERAIDPVDTNPNPEAEIIENQETVARAQREAELHELLRQLPIEERRILEARFLDGRKPREIATQMGRDVKDVYRVLERTVARLKQALT